MSSVPCRSSICLSTEVFSPSPSRNIQRSLLGCQGESCSSAETAADRCLYPLISIWHRLGSHNRRLSASSFLHKLLTKCAIKRERSAEMTEQDFQPGVCGSFSASVTKSLS